jgi:hypothetical protein
MTLDQLIASGEALLDLDAKGALVPHGIGGHAREIIEGFIKLERRSVTTQASEGEAEQQPVAWRIISRKGNVGSIYVDEEEAKAVAAWFAGCSAQPLYAAPQSKRVERLEAALKPFAIELRPDYYPDRQEVNDAPFTSYFTVGQIRAARQALGGRS